MDRNHSLKNQQPKWRLIKKQKETNKQTSEQMTVINVLKEKKHNYPLNFTRKSEMRMLRPLLLCYYTVLLLSAVTKG